VKSIITNKTYEILLIVFLAFDTLINFQNVALAHKWFMLVVLVLDINLWIYFFQKHPKLQRLVFIWSSLMFTFKIVSLLFMPHIPFKMAIAILETAAMFYICWASRKYIITPD